MLEECFDVGEVRVSMLEECFDVGEVRVSMLEPKFQHRNLEFLQHRNCNIETFDVEIPILEFQHRNSEFQHRKFRCWSPSVMH